MTRAVPWNSMEFHGTWIVPNSMTRAVPWNSMEFHGTTSVGVRQVRWHEQFHGIPWNLGCANFADTSSSMEFHGTWSALISMTRAVPWNSMELGVRQFRLHEQFHGIPWNSTELGVRQFRWHWTFLSTACAVVVINGVVLKSSCNVNSLRPSNALNRK